jgi:hypothetical protein
VASPVLDGTLRLGGGGTGYPKFLHFVNQGRALHSQPLRCAGTAANNPIAQFESADNMISLNFLKASHWQI